MEIYAGKNARRGVAYAKIQRQFFDCGYLYGHTWDGVFHGKVAKIA